MNPGVFDHSLNEGLDAGLGRFMSLLVLDAGSPGGFHPSAFNASCALHDGRVVDRWTGGWAHKGKAVVVEVPVGVGNEPPEVLDAVDAIVRDLGVRALLMQTRSSSVGCPAMGRKAAVAVARAKARAVGVMVAGWEESGASLGAGWEI